VIVWRSDFFGKYLDSVLWVKRNHMRSVLNVLATVVIITLSGIVLLYCFGKTPIGIDKMDSAYVWYGMPILFILQQAFYSYLGSPLGNCTNPRGHFDLLNNCVVWFCCVFPIILAYNKGWPPMVINDFYWIISALLVSYHISIWQYLRNLKRWKNARRLR